MASNHNDIKMDTVSTCMLEFYHEENEALHRNLKRAADEIERLTTANRGLKQQRNHLQQSVGRLTLRNQTAMFNLADAERRGNWAMDMRNVLQFHYRRIIMNHPEIADEPEQRDLTAQLLRVTEHYFPAAGEAHEVDPDETETEEEEEEEEE